MKANTIWTHLPDLDGADPGTVFKTARCARGWTLAEAGHRCGFSASTVSRWETKRRNWTVEDLSRVAVALGVPGTLVGLAEKPGVMTELSQDVRQYDPMRRRKLISSSLTVLTAAAIGAKPVVDDGIEQALFNPQDTDPVDLRLLTGRVSAAESHLDAARLAELDRRLPGLLSAAQATWDASIGTAAEQRAASLLSRTLAVTGQQQIRLSREPIASVTADRAARYADLAGNPIAAAEAARVQAVVLRRTGSHVADQVMIAAAERLKAATGLSDVSAAGMYAKLLASAAYTAAGREDRESAAELLATARAELAPWDTTPHVTRADLDVFTVSCDRVLGDHGAALYHARAVKLDRIPSIHERGRYWQDVSIVAFGRGRVDLAVEAIAELEQTAPQYLRHRPWVAELIEGMLYTRQGGASPLVRRLAGQLKIA